MRKRPEAVYFKAGKRPEMDLSLIPVLRGPTRRVGLYVGSESLGDVEEHMDRLEKRAPGLQISLSDSIRSLIQRGAQGFRDDERKQRKSK